MTAYQIYRGNSYALRRPLFTYELVDDAGLAFDLSGSTLLTTWKVSGTDPDTDPDDTVGGVLLGELVVDEFGEATTETRLFMVGEATEGTVEFRLSSADTEALETGVTWVSDVKLIDSNGEVFTFPFSGDTLTAVDGITNRSS